MSSTAGYLTKEQKNQLRPVRLKESRLYHKELIERLHIDPKDFGIKSVYDEDGMEGIPLFGNEFLTEKGYYFEMITKNMEFMPDRQVYKVSRNEEFEKEYMKVSKEIPGVSPRYLVPVAELRPVDLQSVIISKESAVLSSDEILNKNKKKTFSDSDFNVSLEDAPYSEMTIRDYIAIHTGRPVSLKKWLNELVKPF